MKKKLYFILVLFFLTLIKLYYLQKQKSYPKKYTIGIIQCASNKPLDILASSYKDRIMNLAKDNINIIHKNNQGSYIEASIIGEQMHFHEDIDLIFTIGASAALGITKYEDKKPIVISGISDPSVYNFECKENIFGIVDVFDYEKVFYFIKNKYKPKVISVMHSAGKESNSEINPFYQLCAINNISYVDLVVNNENDIISMLSRAMLESDLLIIPCDTMVVSAFHYIAKECLKNKKPLVTCFLDGIDMGATDAIGADYIDYGKNLADLSYQLLQKKKIKNKFIKNSYIIK